MKFIWLLTATNSTHRHRYSQHCCHLNHCCVNCVSRNSMALERAKGPKMSATEVVGVNRAFNSFFSAFMYSATPFIVIRETQRRCRQMHSFNIAAVERITATSEQPRSTSLSVLCAAAASCISRSLESCCYLGNVLFFSVTFTKRSAWSRLYVLSACPRDVWPT